MPSMKRAIVGLIALTVWSCTGTWRASDNRRADCAGTTGPEEKPTEPVGKTNEPSPLSIRRDPHRLVRPTLRRAVRGTAMLVDREQVERLDGDQVALDARSLQQKRDLCPDQPFASQPAPGLCTAFLVGPRTLVTAGHCVRNDPECRATRVVFGYRLRSSEGTTEEISSDDLFECRSLIRTPDSPNRPDIAIVELDRPVPGRTPLRIRRSTPPKNGSRVALIGHPAGLPTKVAPDGRLLEVRPESVLRHDLNTITGDSGSPLVEPTSGDVVGVHVRGSGTFAEAPARDCRVARSCSSGSRGDSRNECAPTEAVATTTFADAIPARSGARSFRFRPQIYDPGAGAVAAQFVVPDVGPVGRVGVDAIVRTDEHTTLEVRMRRTVRGQGGERRAFVEALRAGRRRLEIDFGNLRGRNGRGLWRIEFEPYDSASIRLNRAALWMRGTTRD